MTSADRVALTEVGRRGLSPRAAAVTGIVVIALLCALCFALAFRSGGVGPSSWLPVVIGAAALGVLLSVSGPAVPSSRFQKILLGLFAAQVVWTVVSIIWATSAGNAWEEINRTLFYALGVALAFVAVRWAGQVGLNALAVLLSGTVGVMAVVMVVRLGTDSDPLGFFAGGRLNYPVTYFNGLASLLMIGFWLAMGMANATGTRLPRGESPAEERRTREWFPRWTQPLLLALSVSLLELALLPQSRGALWTFFLVIPFFVILSPHRFRALVDLIIVALPVILFWTRLNGVYAAIRDNAPVDVALTSALEAVGYSVLIMVVAWTVTWLVERGVGPLSRRLILGIGVSLAVLVVACAAGGLVYADQRTGGMGGYLHERWTEFTADRPTGSEGESRFGAVDLSGRLGLWEVAAKAFSENPSLGLGAQNFEIYYYQHRTVLAETNEAHSLPMQLLAELGLPGLLLWLAFFALTLGRAGVLRFRSSDRAAQAVTAAMMTAVISWFIHSSADWLWEVTAVSLPAMMLLGGLVGTGEEGPRREQATRVAAGGSTRAQKSARAIRPIAALLFILVIASAALPYVSLRYSEAAGGVGARDPEKALDGLKTAARLDPTSTFPYALRAGVHAANANRTPLSPEARVEQLKLAAAAWVDATKVDPGNWVTFYQAARALRVAREAAQSSDPGSVAVEDLTRSARTYLGEARRLNPLSLRIDALEGTL